MGRDGGGWRELWPVPGWIRVRKQEKMGAGGRQRTEEPRSSVHQKPRSFMGVPRDLPSVYSISSLLPEDPLSQVSK